jgi:hypothetical protein
MGSNGRININSVNTTKLFEMKDKIPTNSNCGGFSDALTGNWEDTMLSRAFFSGANIQALQNGIRAGVYNNSKGQYIIGEQNLDELKIIMRSIFLQNSKNLVSNITQQISDLNNDVLEYAIKQVYMEVESYMKYKRDVSNMHTPITLPVTSSIKGKSVIFKHGF